MTTPRLSFGKRLWLNLIDHYNSYKEDHFLRKAAKQWQALVRKEDMQGPILLFGYVKSGNTWTRFLLYNYLNIRDNGAEETLSYQELNDWQNLMIHQRVDLGQLSYTSPPVFSTHHGYHASFAAFDKLVYIYRNPLDTLISSYFFYANRNKSVYSKYLQEELKDIDFYVKYYTERWIRHAKGGLEHADVALSYERLKRDTYQEVRPFIALFEADGIVDEETLRQSIAFSDFKNIKKMGREKKQEEGMGRDNKVKTEFTRSGATAQYEQYLRPETIAAVQEKVAAAGLNIDYR